MNTPTTKIMRKTLNFPLLMTVTKNSFRIFPVLDVLVLIFMHFNDQQQMLIIRKCSLTTRIMRKCRLIKLDKLGRHHR